MCNENTTLRERGMRGPCEDRGRDRGMWPPAKEHTQPPGAGRGGKDTPVRPWLTHSPTESLTSGFCLTELGRDTVLLFQATNSVTIVLQMPQETDQEPQGSSSTNLFGLSLGDLLRRKGRCDPETTPGNPCGERREAL